MNDISSNLNDAQLADINSALAPVHDAFVAGVAANTLPQVFIIGAPRSGTTLAHQLLTSYSDIGYINNLTARFWRVPALAMALQSDAGGFEMSVSDFKSQFGATQGAAGPHEFGFFWRRWFNYGASHHVEAAHISAEATAKLVAECHAMAEVSKRAMLFKNLAACGMNAGYLAQVLPQSLFLMIGRQKTDTMRSILQARQSYQGDIDAWFSVRPPGWADVKDQTPVEQVSWQVDAIQRHILSELAALPPARVRQISYDTLRNSPDSAVSQITDWINSHGGAVTRTPEAITLPDRKPAPSTLPQSIETALDTIPQSAPPALPFQALVASETPT